ncbi:MAG: SH3 domain-containing protein [Acidobacteria bacterium]|nr:SH3 domain-containing protein [Acidobacteriota bacterium]
MLGAVAAALSTACLTRSAPETAPVPPPPVEVAPAPAPAPPAGPDPAIAQAEGRARELELSVLEKDAEIKSLGERLSSQQRRLDDAIQEVVRAKAKLMSLESRAEAASQMAETEIALKAVEGEEGAAQDPELEKIRKLVQMSSAEFEKENFGGALYLASQAKERIQDSQTRLGGREKVDIGRDETPFPVPMAVKVAKSSNVRKLPDRDAAIVVTLSAGTAVTAYSHKGEWIRVTAADGVQGWVHQSLITSR